MDKVDETQGTCKWSQKAKDALEKMNTDFNLTAGLKSFAKDCSGSMLCRNIDM